MSAIPLWFWATAAGLFGLAMGSFFTVLTYRWPREESLVSPRSRCTSCGHQLRWYENIPVDLMARARPQVRLVPRADLLALPGTRAGNGRPRSGLHRRVRRQLARARGHGHGAGARSGRRHRPGAQAHPQHRHLPGSCARADLRDPGQPRVAGGFRSRVLSAQRRSCSCCGSSSPPAWVSATSSSPSCSAPCSARR